MDTPADYARASASNEGLNMEDVLGRLIEETGKGQAVALASLVWSTGSIPMSDSAKMLVTEGEKSWARLVVVA